MAGRDEDRPGAVQGAKAVPVGRMLSWDGREYRFSDEPPGALARRHPGELARTRCDAWHRLTLTGPDYPSRTMAGSGDSGCCLGCRRVGRHVRAGGGVLDRPAADGRPGPLQAEYDDGAAGHAWHGDRLVRAGAARGGAVYGYPAEPEAGDHSIEDKGFEHNWGINLYRAVGAAYQDIHSHTPGAGLVDADDAAGAQPVSFRAEDLQPEAARKCS